MEKVNMERAKAQVRRIQLYKDVFGSEQGQEVLMDLMRTHHVLGTTYSPKDPNQIHIYEGERNVVLRILTYLELDTDELLKRMREASKREN